ncbi:MAG: LUD domain-containing protein [Lachnospiraceae bacterium]|nr:LUD domain-containing protein [Lachnospiraceae bacterium]
MSYLSERYEKTAATLKKNFEKRASIDKMCTDVDEAVRRVHLIAAPPNALRVKADTPCARTGVCADCLSPDCICCQTLITRKSRIPGRITVVLTGEHLGF